MFYESHSAYLDQMGPAPAPAPANTKTRIKQNYLLTRYFSEANKNRPTSETETLTPATRVKSVLSFSSGWPN